MSKMIGRVKRRRYLGMSSGLTDIPTLMLSLTPSRNLNPAPPSTVQTLGPEEYGRY